MVASSPDRPILVGKLSAVYGVRGWLKVYSYTEPAEQIFTYADWYLTGGDFNSRHVRPAETDVRGNKLLVRLDAVEDREQAQRYCGLDISVCEDAMPATAENEYYWHQLEGLTVITSHGAILGRVDHLLRAGASNDVLVVRGNAESIDYRERLVPYVAQFVCGVCLTKGEIRVDWDPDF